MSPLHVIISGAGLGGLALAQGLHRAGISVAVYERDATPAIRNQGYRIRINSDGITALAAVLSPAAYELFAATAGMPGPRMNTFDEQLNLMHAYRLPDADLPGGGHLAVNRVTLRQILLSGLDDVVHYGSPVTGFTISDKGSVTVRFTDGTSARGDVFVGADGVNSPTRRRYLPQAEVMDAGLRLLYGKVPLADPATRALVPDDLLGLWTTIVESGKRFVGLAPVRFPDTMENATARLAPHVQLSPANDYLTCVYGARTEQLALSDSELFAMNGSQLRELAMAATHGWSPIARTIVAAQDPATVFAVTVRSSVPLPAWESTPVTLIGDAVHVMSPAIGVGANTALRDASLLSARLIEAARGRGLLEAINDYETAMRDYGFAAVRESAQRGHDLVGQNPLPVAAH